MNWDTATPELVTLVNNVGFVQSGVESPGQNVFLSIEVPLAYFNKTAVIDFKQTEDKDDPFKKGKLLWEVAMQCTTVEVVRVFTDDVEKGLYLAGNFQNDETFPFLIGKLNRDCELHKHVEKCFTKFAST